SPTTSKRSASSRKCGRCIIWAMPPQPMTPTFSRSLVPTFASPASTVQMLPQELAALARRFQWRERRPGRLVDDNVLLDDQPAFVANLAQPVEHAVEVDAPCS